MGYDYDNIIAELPCPNCGVVAQVAAATCVRSGADLKEFRVGDRLEINPNFFSSDPDYLILRQPGPGEAIRIVEYWGCSSCKTGFHWLEFVVEDRKIESVQGVTLDSTTVGRAHAVTHWAVDYLSNKTGRDLVGRLNSEVAQLLMDSPPD